MIKIRIVYQAPSMFSSTGSYETFITQELFDNLPNMLRGRGKIRIGQIILDVTDIVRIYELIERSE